VFSFDQTEVRDPAYTASFPGHRSGLLASNRRRGGAQVATHFIPTCWICNKTIALEACKIEEYEKSVHAECYAGMLADPVGKPTGARDERWREFCAVAAKEPDRETLAALVQAIDQLRGQIKHLKQLGKAPSVC